MALLTPTRYYTARKSASSPASDYWSPKADPDGCVRDRLADVAERNRYVADLSAELFFTDQLPGGSAIDVGCGPAWFLAALGDQWTDLVGVEPSPRARAAADDLITMVEHVEDVGNDQFDLVISYHVIEHLRHPMSHLYELRRLCRTGGHLILGTPDFGSPCAKRFGEQYRMLHDPTHISLFTAESIQRAIRDLGWEIVDVQFPFPDRYAVADNLLRWNDITAISPAWPGNWVTVYGRKP